MAPILKLTVNGMVRGGLLQLRLNGSCSVQERERERERERIKSDIAICEMVFHLELMHFEHAGVKNTHNAEHEICYWCIIGLS